MASPLSFAEIKKEPAKVAVKLKIEENIIKKPIKTEVVKSSGAITSVLSAKVENISPTAAPVMNLKTPTPIDKYIQAKSVLSPVTNIFEVLKIIYLSAIFFFALALLLNIFIEIRKQHSHVIFQTFSLIALLVVLWKF